MAGEETPLTVAFTVYVPGVEFAVAVRVAMPDAFVVAVPVPRVADAPPVDGTAAKETVVFGTGVPFESATRTASELPNAAPVDVSWLFPE